MSPRQSNPQGKRYHLLGGIRSRCGLDLSERVRSSLLTEDEFDARPAVDRCSRCAKTLEADRRQAAEP